MPVTFLRHKLVAKLSGTALELGNAKVGWLVEIVRPLGTGRQPRAKAVAAKKAASFIFFLLLENRYFGCFYGGEPSSSHQEKETSRWRQSYF